MKKLSFALCIIMCITGDHTRTLFSMEGSTERDTHTVAQSVTVSTQTEGMSQVSQTEQPIALIIPYSIDNEDHYCALFRIEDNPSQTPIQTSILHFWGSCLFTQISDVATYWQQRTLNRPPFVLHEYPNGLPTDDPRRFIFFVRIDQPHEPKAFPMGPFEHCALIPFLSLRNILFKQVKLSNEKSITFCPDIQSALSGEEICIILEFIGACSNRRSR